MGQAWTCLDFLSWDYTMTLAETIQNYKVSRGSVAAWWLGQNGFIFKTTEGTLVSIDLYLSNSATRVCKDLPINMQRQVPIFIQPCDLVTDVYACTHSHVDHADPDTISNLRNKDTMQFVGPSYTCSIYNKLGIEDSRIHQLWPQQEIEFKDVKLRGTFALPTDETDLNHMGYLLTFSEKFRIYITGDTDYSELLASVASHSPQVLITCINGNFNNLSHWEAAGLAKLIRPNIAIPCHYDMFADNSIDPKQFRASLKLCAPNTNYLELVHAEPHLFSF